MNRPTMNDSLQQQECLITPLPQAGRPGRMVHRTAQQRYVLPLLGALVCLLLSVGTSQAAWVKLAPSTIPYHGAHLCPVETGGDREFNGNGPHVYVSVWLHLPSDGKNLYGNISAQWRETKSDWSAARLYRGFLIYSPPGQRITAIWNARDSGVVYTDTDNDQETFYPPDTLVDRFLIQGDTWGNDLGNCTLGDAYLYVYFEPIWVWVE